MAHNNRDDVIRVGIVGAGENTRLRHIPGLRQQPQVEIVAVCNRTVASSRRVADAFGIPGVYSDWTALVSADDIDAVVIGTWPYMHCPVTVAALGSGKHVMCEARMAMNLAEAQQMLAASQARPDLVAQIVPAPMTLHLDQTVRRLLDEGVIGSLLFVDIQGASGGFLDSEAPMTWRQDVVFSGQNVMAMGIWYETVMRWVGEASRVVARGETFVRRRQSVRTGVEEPVQIPDHLDILADLDCGAKARFVFSNVMGLAEAPEAGLYGDGGTLRVKGGQLFGARKPQQQVSPIVIPDAERGGWQVESDFIRAIRGEAPIRLTRFEDGVRYMAFTHAVAESLRSGGAAMVPR